MFMTIAWFAAQQAKLQRARRASRRSACATPASYQHTSSARHVKCGPRASLTEVNRTRLAAPALNPFTCTGVRPGMDSSPRWFAPTPV